jgi:hypothetical protein
MTRTGLPSPFAAHTGAVESERAAAAAAASFHDFPIVNFLQAWTPDGRV